MKSQTSDGASDAKQAIKKIVKLYQFQYPAEYELLVDAVALTRNSLKNPKFAKAESAGQGSDMRGLFEISETLDGMLTNALSIEHMMWFKTKPGGRWFAKTFGEFALPYYI